MGENVRKSRLAGVLVAALIAIAATAIVAPSASANVFMKFYTSQTSSCLYDPAIYMTGDDFARTGSCGRIIRRIRDNSANEWYTQPSTAGVKIVNARSGRCLEDSGELWPAWHYAKVKPCSSSPLQNWLIHDEYRSIKLRNLGTPQSTDCIGYTGRMIECDNLSAFWSLY